MTNPNMETFMEEISRQLKLAKANGENSITLLSGNIHRAVGGYPQRNHRMRTCCDAMYAQTNKYEVIKPPKSGYGATLSIKYYL